MAEHKKKTKKTLWSQLLNSKIKYKLFTKSVHRKTNARTLLSFGRFFVPGREVVSFSCLQVHSENIQNLIKW